MKVSIEMKSVTKDFLQGNNVIRALKETDFKAYEGELIAIIRPSGSGKSILKQIYLLIFRFKLFKFNTSPLWLTDAKIYKKA